MANFHKHWYGTLADYTAVATKDSNTLYHCSEGLIYKGSVLLATRRWGDLSGKPSTFAPSAHTHTKSQITDFPTTWAWASLTGVPSTFTPSAHTHDDRYYTETEVNTLLTNKAKWDTAYGWGNHASAGYALNSALTTHTGLTNNPHGVTKSQIGLGNVLNVASYSKTQSDTNLTNAISAIEIGGRNLLLDTRKATFMYTKTADEYLGFTICRSTKATGHTDTFRAVTIKPATSGSYIVSFYAKSSVNGTIHCYFYSPNTTILCKSSTGYSGSGVDGYTLVDITTEWKRYWVCWTQSETTTVKSVIIGRNIIMPTGAVVEIAGVKLEEGNIATDWTPAPEDVDASIALVQTNLNTHASLTNNPHSVTKSQIGLGSVNNTADSTKNVLSATKLTTTRKIWGQDFNGTASISGAITGATSGEFSTKVTTGGYNYTAQLAGVGIGADGTNNGIMFYNGTGATGRIYRESDVMRFIRGGLSYSGFDINADGSVTVQGDMTTRTSLVVGSGNGTYVQIGSARLVYDQTNNAIKVVNANNSSCSLYATGSISAFGIGSSGGSGTSYTRLDDWGDYLDGLTNDYILSAELGHGLYTSVNTLNSFRTGTAWGGSASGYSYLSIDGTIKALSIHGHSHSFASLSSKPTTLSGYGITDAMSSSGGTFLKSTFQILELKRNGAAGASMTFSNTSRVLAKFGFDVTGSLVIGTGTSTDGVPDMLSINASTKKITGYGDLAVSGSIETGTSDGAYIRTGNVRFLYDNSVVGIRLLKVSGGHAPFYASAVYANEVQLTSSRSMKKDIQPFKNGLDLIKSIDVVSYLYKQDADDDDRKIGFIADDTDSWLSGKSKTKYNIGNTVGALIKAVQELEKKNQELEMRLLSTTNNKLRI